MSPVPGPLFLMLLMPLTGPLNVSHAFVHDNSLEQSDSYCTGVRTVGEGKRTTRLTHSDMCA